MKDERPGPGASSPSPSTLDVYFGLVAILKAAGVREPGGSVSCQRMAGINPCYLVAAEAYVAGRVQVALTKLLSRPVSFSGKARVTLSPEEASRVAACVEAFPGRR